MFILHEAQSILVITIIWILVRLFIARIHKPDIKRELMLLLIYICIIVVFHFTMAGSTVCLTDPELHRFAPKLNLKAFNFLTDRYDGWQRNIIGNFTMFIPVGFVWPLVFTKLNTYGKAVGACFLYTLVIEILQLLLYERTSDVDDLILNTAGAAIGAGIWFLIKEARKDDRLAAIRVALFSKHAAL